MKKKAFKDQIKTMTAEALEQEKLDLLKEQFSYKIQRATGQLKKTHRMKEIRRSIAQIKTILAEKTRVSEDV